MEKRTNEILGSMTSFTQDLYSKSEVLPELFDLQSELVNLTFNENHAENGNLRIWDVENHLEKMNADCGHIADEELSNFKEKCKIICNTIKGEMSGKNGEYKAFRSLETMICKNKILKNIEFKGNDRRTELDAVVITEKAVFIIEVKNPSKDIYIDERGNYCRISHDTMVFDKNIGENMNNKGFLLREALRSAGYENANIVNIVVFTNSAIHVENRYPYVNTCYLSDLPHKISRYDGEALYSSDDMDTMTSAIESSRCHEAYPMPIDMQEFKRDFANLMAILEKAKEESSEQTESIIKDDVIIAEEANDKFYNNALNWLKKHRVSSRIVASVALVAFASVAAVSATTHNN